MTVSTNFTARCVSWCLCALLASSGELFACELIKRSVAIGAYYNLGSEHDEYFPSGSQILNERGMIPGGVIVASISCDRWMLDGELSLSSGVRDYKGMNTRGSPVNTISKIKSDASRLGIAWRLLEPLDLMADVVLEQTSRDIVGTLDTQGYPETYDRRFVRFGARWSVPMAFGLLTLSGLTSISGHQSEVVKLPGKDPASLSFQEPSQWELGFSLRKMLNTATYLHVEYRYVNTTIKQSFPSVLTAAGNPVGVVYQPRTMAVDQPFALTLGMYF